MHHEHQGDNRDHDRDPSRDRNQTRHADDRNGRLRYGEGGRYHGTDYDDPRAEYERSQSGGWGGGDAYAEHNYGRRYSESGGSRGGAGGSEYDQGRVQMQRRGFDDRGFDDRGFGDRGFGDRGAQAGRYGGYAAWEEAAYGPQRQDYGPNRYGYEPSQYGFAPGRHGPDRYDFRDYPQERFGVGASGGESSASYYGSGTGRRDDRDRPGESGGYRGHEAHGRWPGSRDAYGQRSGYGGGLSDHDMHHPPHHHGPDDGMDHGSMTYGGGMGRQGLHGYGGQRGKGPRNYTRSDERITEDVNERLMHDDLVDATDITVTVSNGEVTLQGTVDDRQAKHRIEDIAERCPGVKDVENHIRVKRADDQAGGNGNAGGKSSTSRGVKTQTASSPSSTS